MPDHEHGDIWLPKLFDKQFDIFNCGTEADGWKRFILVDGGRMSGKSLAVAHRVFRHLWETPGARVGLVAKTYKNAKRGAWADLIEITAPEWFDSKMIGETGLPIEYTSRNAGGPGPGTDNLTRTPFFRIRNYFGGESELLLYSLDNDDEVEAKLKSTRFSMLWFSELSNFQQRKVFDISILDLRMTHIPMAQQIWIADTNPAEDGQDSWIYKLWYQEINAKDHKQPNFQKALRHIHVRLEDNIFLEQTAVETLKGTYANDPGEYDRNVNGLWVKGHGTLDKHFADLIIPDIHYVDPAIDIDRSTGELFTGWDIGSVNNAAFILERRIIQEISYWMILDEVVTIGEQITTQEFAGMVYEKMLNIENFYHRRFDWTHWSDDSALNAYRGGTGGMDASEVLKATYGKVNLQAVEKPANSVLDSIRILRRLLRDKRLFVGRNCPLAIEMLEGLRVAENGKVEDGPLKHPFDGLRYPIYMEEREWTIQHAMPQASQRSSVMIHAG